MAHRGARPARRASGWVAKAAIVPGALIRSTGIRVGDITGRFRQTAPWKRVPTGVAIASGALSTIPTRGRSPRGAGSAYGKPRFNDAPGHRSTRAIMPARKLPEAARSSQAQMAGRRRGAPARLRAAPARSAPDRSARRALTPPCPCRRAAAGRWRPRVGSIPRGRPPPRRSSGRTGWPGSGRRPCRG